MLRADASAESIRNNKLTLKNIESWKRENIRIVSSGFFLSRSLPGHLKDWGVGLARKTGMDEAVRRFNQIERPDGVILNLDADCQVEKNYFVSVCDELLKRNGEVGLFNLF